MADVVHRYFSRVWWTGNTGLGYEHYDRTHEASAPPASVALQLSSDPAFRGNPNLLNPEQLLVLAAASCQLLSFLAVASRARIKVVSYEDTAEAEMPEGNRPVRLTKITLKPRIMVEGDIPEERIRHYVEVAHRECYIANSLQTEIVIEPVIGKPQNNPLG